MSDGDCDTDVETSVGGPTAAEYGGDDSVSHLEPSQKQTITMEVTVDASHMSDPEREAFQRLATVYEDGFSEVVAKNGDYSWSFLREAKKLAETSGYPIDSVVRAQVSGLLHRSGDKRERLTENVFGDGAMFDDDESSVSDTPAQTAAEAANYYCFMAFVLDNPSLAAALPDV